MSAPARAQISDLQVAPDPLSTRTSVADWRSWVTAVGSWGGDLSPDGSEVVFISDRSGSPCAWVAPAFGEATPRLLPTGLDHVESVSWSPDGEWIAVLGAPGGETTRTRVWVVRPDGSDAHRVAGVRSGTANFGPWLRTGAVLPLSTSGRRPEETSSTLLNVHTGVTRRLAYGAPFAVLDLRHDGEAALVRVGGRGRRTLVAVDLAGGTTETLAPGSEAGEGMTDQGCFLPDGRVLARSNVRRDRHALVALERGGVPRVMAIHPGGELDHFAVTDDGRLAALVWNIRGSSLLEMLDLSTGRRRRVSGGPDVIERVRFSADGAWLLACGHGPRSPRGLYRLETAAVTLLLVDFGVSTEPLRDREALVVPSAETVYADDGLTIEGWLYRPPGTSGPVPTVIHLHGGPEAQERPGYAPLFQALVAVGIAVFAPNVRGSTGYGRAYEHADDGPLRYAAISDVAACALHLLRVGIATPDRLACMGRSYGGYLTLAALTFHPELFAAGVDVCGMSDLQTFYANTEPWVAAVATPKYGDPCTDAELLADLSPLRRFQRLRAPLLAIHGMNDRNVPVSESVQAVDAARERGVEAELLLFPDEGHEIARPEGRLRFVTSVVEFLGRHLQPA